MCEVRTRMMRVRGAYAHQAVRRSGRGVPGALYRGYLLV